MIAISVISLATTTTRALPKVAALLVAPICIIAYLNFAYISFKDAIARADTLIGYVIRFGHGGIFRWGSGA